MNKPLNVLFYQPYNQAVNYIESILEAMINQGHRGYFLSHQSPGDTHKNIEKFGGETFSQPLRVHIPGLYHLQRVWQLVHFCRKYKIDIVYSHYQEANLIAVLAQYFTTAKFVITRHHSDCGYVDRNYREIIGDKIINRLANVYIAPSQKVYEQIVEAEGANSEKVKRIDYGYNFSSFTSPDTDEVVRIRESYNARLLLVKAARLIPEKRHLILFRVLKDLVAEGMDIKALILGKGSNSEELEGYVKTHQLENHIFLLGFKKNVQDYFAAADLVVHLSVSEASNSAIKEAGLIGKTTVVCEKVGDFSDYFIHGQNGFLLNKYHPDQELRELLQEAYDGKLDRKMIGKSLKETVTHRFSVENVSSEYNDIHKTLFA